MKKYKIYDFAPMCVNTGVCGKLRIKNSRKHVNCGFAPQFTLPAQIP